MRRLVFAAVAFCLVLPASARSLQDLAVLGVLQRSDTSVAVLEKEYRAQVTPELDVVVVVGNHRTWTPDSGFDRLSLTPRLGLFLQDRVRPELVYTLAIEPWNGGPLPVERATATDVLISTMVEKQVRGEAAPHLKFVYDVRAKKIVSRFTFDSSTWTHLVELDGDVVFTATDGTRWSAARFEPGSDPPFRVLRDREASRWIDRAVEVQAAEERDLAGRGDRFEPIAIGADGMTRLIEAGEAGNESLVVAQVRDGKERRHAVPQSTRSEFARMRPEENQNLGGGVDIEEYIGGWDVDGDRLWVGKSFYDSEGTSGVGAFGWFDAGSAKYVLFSPPEVRDWSVDALHVDPEAAWMALVYNGEWGSNSGGLLRFDRATETVRRLEMPDVGHQFVRVGEHLLLATDFGVCVVTGDEIRRYFVDRMTDGRLRMAEGLMDVALRRHW